MASVDVPEILRNEDRSGAEDIFTNRTRVAYLGKGRSLCVVLGKYKMYVDTSDVGFAPHMMLDGYWEYWLTKFIADSLTPGDVVLDIGANLGYYTLLMSDIVGGTGRVHAFEPNPTVFPLLKSTVALNGFSGRAELYNAALTSDPEATSLPLFVPNDDPKNGTIVTAGYADPRGRIDMVQAITLDAVPLSRLDFVKIDIEGAEVGVLEGLQPLKRKFRPKIVVEVNFGRSYSYDDIVALVGHGNELLHIDFDAQVKPLTREMAAETRIHEDWLVYWPGRSER